LSRGGAAADRRIYLQTEFRLSAESHHAPQIIYLPVAGDGAGGVGGAA